MMHFFLPANVALLVAARNQLRDLYKSSGLRFTFDGNLVGDLGEAIAAEIYGLSLHPRGEEGVDSTARDGRTVQIKATGTGRGPAFRFIEKRANHLLFLDMNFEDRTVAVIFNGPEKIALNSLPDRWIGQRSLTAKQIRDADLKVDASERLKPVIAPTLNK